MKAVKVIVSNIKWDEADDIESTMELIIPVDTFENSESEDFRDDVEEYIADEISNISGFCHDGFSYEIVVDGYSEIRILLEKATAIQVEHRVFSSYSIESEEEIQEYLRDNENPMVFSLYGIWEDGENIEYHFDMSDIEKAIINNDLSIAIDGKTIQILAPLTKEHPKLSLGHIILHRDELPSDAYNAYKAMPNVIVEREDTDDEFLKFITVPASEEM
jgi:hypothetical protein